MRKIFPDFTYSDGPRDGCWWDETVNFQSRPSVRGCKRTDVAIVGAGFTGLSAALHLAEKGTAVTVVDAHFPGWGASGRNGGFCCLGGGKISDAALDVRFGREGRIGWHRAELAAVELAENLINRLNMDVDRHSTGETALAIRPRDFEALKKSALSVPENYGVEPQLLDAEQLATHGMNGVFCGAMTIPVGFGLNPRKYLSGLTGAAEEAGAEVFHESPVLRLKQHAAGYRLTLPQGEILAEQVIVATNGYSSETIPGWLAGRYMPGQSTVMVTRPLTDQELQAQGWTTDQMSFDTRNLLHYFRLMPDRRFLFGMRGGLLAGPDSEIRARRRVRRDFEAMFPAWRDVPGPFVWSGMVSLARDKLPFSGPVPGHPGLWASLCYHGNGVAMGTLSGSILADLILGEEPAVYPLALRQPLRKFPFGRARRVLMPPLYLGLMLADL